MSLEVKVEGNAIDFVCSARVSITERDGGEVCVLRLFNFGRYVPIECSVR
jgi:hypothetical protein